MKGIGRWLLFAALGLCGAGGWALLTNKSELRFGMNAEPAQESLWIVAYGYFVTVVGVILGSGYRELQKRRVLGEQRIGSFPVFVTQIVRSIDLWMGLFGSPLVFALLWRAIEGGSEAGLTAIALQNGFTCTIVLGSAIEGRAPRLDAEERRTH